MKTYPKGLSKLRKIREKQNMLLHDLAEAIGTTKSYISYIETGKQDCSIKMARRIADYFKVKIDDLL